MKDKKKKESKPAFPDYKWSYTGEELKEMSKRLNKSDWESRFNSSMKSQKAKQ
jgi:hypothetical protein